jgi:hypothetical protein
MSASWPAVLLVLCVCLAAISVLSSADGAGAFPRVLQVAWNGCVMHPALLRQLCFAAMSVLNRANGAGALPARAAGA